MLSDFVLHYANFNLTLLRGPHFDNSGSSKRTPFFYTHIAKQALKHQACHP